MQNLHLKYDRKPCLYEINLSSLIRAILDFHFIHISLKFWKGEKDTRFIHVSLKF
jgi:hypothetical protein